MLLLSCSPLCVSFNPTCFELYRTCGSRFPASASRLLLFLDMGFYSLLSRTVAEEPSPCAFKSEQPVRYGSGANADTDIKLSWGLLGSIASSSFGSS